MEILVGTRYCTSRPLRRHEAAAVIRVTDGGVLRSITEHDVRNRLRRGQRMQEAGQTAIEVARRGGLTVSWVGRRRFVSLPSVVESIAADQLALDVLGDILEGHVRVPRAGVADLYDLL